MRILVVTPWFPSEGHPAAGIFNLRDANLLARDHDVRVLHLIRPEWHSQPEHASEEVEVLRIPFAPGDPRTWGEAIRMIRQEAESVELVHSMAFPALLPLSRARVGKAWVHTEHWSGLSASRSGFHGLAGTLLKPLLRLPDAVVAVSEALARELQGSTRYPPDLIENAVDLLEPGCVRERPDLSNCVRAVGVGGLIPGKGPIEAVETIAELRSRGIDASLQWVGAGHLAPNALERAKECGISEQVVLTGELNREGVREALLDANLFLLPTQGETFGVAIAEALGAGLPVVTSGQGGHEAFLPAGASRLVSRRTATALADAVLDLAADAERWDSDRIMAYAHDTFSEESRRERYQQVYSRALQRAASRTR